MIDTEVVRMQRLRNTALSARAFAAALDPNPARRGSLFSRSALICWQIARVITGTLRAHPYPKYQREPSGLRGDYDRLSATLRGGIVRYRRRSLQTLSDELRRVARELDDARALTWSAEMSDIFGRSQAHVRKLLRELDVGVRSEVGSRDDRVSPLQPEVGTRANGDVAGNWPYLAF